MLDLNIPNHLNRTANEIISETIYHDAFGFSYRAASWLDLAQRSGDFAAFHYACIDARLAIEHLIFEQLVISAGNALDQSTYQQCLSNQSKLDKMLKKLVSDYNKLQEFTAIIALLTPQAPPINQWNLQQLRRDWGRLSRYLHWSGSFAETTESESWQQQAIVEVLDIVPDLWRKISTGHSGAFSLDSMKPVVKDIWEEFKTGGIDSESARIRLELVRPLARTS